MNSILKLGGMILSNMDMASCSVDIEWITIEILVLIIIIIIYNDQ